MIYMVMEIVLCIIIENKLLMMMMMINKSNSIEKISQFDRKPWELKIGEKSVAPATRRREKYKRNKI
jgi:hypothetical protein